MPFPLMFSNLGWFVTLGGIEQLKEARNVRRMRAPYTANGRLGGITPGRSRCWAHGAYRVRPVGLNFLLPPSPPNNKMTHRPVGVNKLCSPPRAVEYETARSGDPDLYGA